MEEGTGRPVRPVNHPSLKMKEKKYDTENVRKMLVIW